MRDKEGRKKEASKVKQTTRQCRLTVYCCTVCFERGSILVWPSREPYAMYSCRVFRATVVMAVPLKSCSDVVMSLRLAPDLTPVYGLVSQGLPLCV